MPLFSSALLLLAAAPPPVVAAPGVTVLPPAQSPGYRMPGEARARIEQLRLEREAQRQRDMRSRATIAADVTIGGERLWKGTLLVGGRSAASIDRSETQALPFGCMVDDEARSMAERNSFSLRLQNPEFPEGRVTVRFNVSLQRPAATCAEAQFTRRIELSGSLQFKPGETVTVTGDGGLVARFTLVRREVAKD
ncbi:MAG: hypothetical protein AB7G25_04705 [Sphingomonadaceae bacterium]